MADTDDINRDYARARELIGQGRKGLDDASALLRQLRNEVRNIRPRGRLNQAIWDCERALGRARHFFSQSGQDAWLEANVFRGKRDGVFVEIGGYDGVTGSNTLFFEMMRGWSGLLIEPSPAPHAQAEQARRCPCLRLAVAGAEGEAAFLDVRAGLTQMGGLIDSYDAKTRTAVEADPRHKGAVIRVPTRPLADILDEHGLTEIDYISLDVEGGEMAVLSAFPFAKYRIAAWTIENNAGGEEIAELMQTKGYRLAEALGVDDVYLGAESRMRDG
jgi:FkbM family methyltransferase